MDKELDDFLPEGESLPEEEFLTKWSRDLEDTQEQEEEKEPSASSEETDEEASVPQATALRQRRPQGRRVVWASGRFRSSSFGSDRSMLSRLFGGQQPVC